MNNKLIKQNVPEILLNIDAVSISLTQPFVYASGLQSPIYTNCRILSNHPKERDEIIRRMVKQINDLKEKIDLVVSSTTSSIFIASLVAQHLDLPMAYVRPSVKTHGKMKQIEGVFKAGDKVLLISDIISTENEIPKSVEIIQKNGGSVIHCLAVFSNNLGITESLLKENNVSYSFLTDLSNLLKVAHEKSIISLEEKLAIEEWGEDPENWYQKSRIRIEDELKDIDRKISQILLQIGAVKINEKKPFTYTSGLKSPIYTDNRLIISHPNKWQYIIDSFLYSISNVIGTQNFDIIAGTATSGIPHATLIADRLGLPMVYVKLEEGEEGYIEGKIKKGDRVIIIEDHVSTGKSVLSSAKILRDSGAIIDYCVAIFTYEMPKSILKFEEENIKLLSLSNLSTMINVAIEMNYINPQEKTSVFKWVENPEGWK